MFRKAHKQPKPPKVNSQVVALEAAIARWEQAHEQLNQSLCSPVKRRIFKVIYDYMLDVCNAQLSIHRRMDFSALFAAASMVPTLEAEMNMMAQLQACHRLHDDPCLVEIERIARRLPENSRLRQNLQHECSTAALELQTRRGALHQKVQVGALCVALLAFYESPILGMCTLGLEMCA